MCRKNLFYGGVLLALGAGILVSLVIEGVLLRLLLGAAAIAGGIFLLRG